MSTSSLSRHASRISTPHPLPPNFLGLSCPCSCLTDPSVSLFLSLYFGFKNGRGGKVSPFLPCRGSLLTCWVKNSDVLPVTPESCLWVFAVIHQQWWPGLETDKRWGWCPFSSISTMPPPRVHLSTGVNCTPGICVTFCAGHQGYRGGPGWTQPCAVKLAAALI